MPNHAIEDNVTSVRSEDTSDQAAQRALFVHNVMNLGCLHDLKEEASEKTAASVHLPLGNAQNIPVTKTSADQKRDQHHQATGPTVDVRP